jgi:exonuclease SbcC
MIPLKLKIAGTYAFREETEIPLYAEPGIVALAGDNGSGKTTILNTMHAALHGTSPDRVSESGADGGSKAGTIYELFPFANGMVDFEFEMGGRNFRIKRLVDGVRRKQTPYLWIDGRPITEGKVKEFDEAIFRETGLTEEFFLASIYACQSGRGAVNELGDKDRRNLLDQVLDLAEFDEPLEWVSAEHRRVSDEIEALEKKLDSAPTADLAELRKRLAELRAGMAGGEKRIADAKRELADYQQRLADLRAGQQDVTDAKKRADLLAGEVADLERQIAEREARIAKNKSALLDRRDEILKAVGYLAALESQIEATRAEQKTLTTERERQQAESDEEAAVLRERLKVAREDLEAIKRDREAFEEVRAKAEKTLALLEQETAQATEQSKTLRVVACIDEPRFNSTCELLASARAAAEKLPVLKDKAEVERDAIERLSYDLELFGKRDAGCRKALADLEAALAALAEKPGLKLLSESIKAHAQTIEVAEAHAKGLRDLAGLKPQLDGAEERIAEYRAEISSLRQQRTERETLWTEIQHRLADAGDDTAETTLTAQADEARERIESLERREKDAIAAIAKLEVEIDRAEKAEREVAEIRQEIAAKKSRLAKVQVLREGLGPKGVRALRIDAAGPGISATVNELLEACYGTRFQVRIQTQRETAAGDLKEALRITVIDNETGVESLIANKSGGEGAVIGEALSLGLALYKRQQFGADLRTLIRDETTAPLSEHSGELYMRMLRRARELGGFWQIIYVTHKSSLVSEADAVIDLDGGRPVLRVAV